MRVYIDKLNLLSLFESKSREHPLFDDCFRMLKSQCDLFFNFSKEDIKSDESINAIFKQLSSGSKDSPMPEFLDKIFPQRPLKSNFHIDLCDRNDLTAAYLLSDDKVQNAKEKGYILIGGEGEEVATLSQLFYEDYQFSKNFTPQRDMPNWRALRKTILPCTDIILVDRYVFSDETLLKYNLHSFVSEIGGKIKDKKIKVVIFTCRTQEGKGADGKKVYFTPDWDKLKSDIKTSLQQNYAATSSVTIVALRRVDEHDRTIFTNYNNSYSGDSLIYYNSKEEVITNGRNYEVRSHGLRDNLKKGLEFIDDMQSILETAPIDGIIGDRKSNFLKFPD